jgi:hypothetical protein
MIYIAIVTQRVMAAKGIIKRSKNQLHLLYKQQCHHKYPQITPSSHYHPQFDCPQIEEMLEHPGSP